MRGRIPPRSFSTDSGIKNDHRFCDIYLLTIILANFLEFRIKISHTLYLVNEKIETNEL